MPLRIDESFLLEFGRDVDYSSDDQHTAYLDRDSGEIVWVFEDDQLTEGTASPEENAELRRRVADNPTRYLEVPRLDHGDHHDILREFLDSDWTEDENAKRNAEQAYIGSIGHWIKKVEAEGAVSSYYEFRDRKIAEMASDFLRKHGINK
jgi:hypothetical protein